MTPNGKTIDGTQKCRGPKMMAQTTSITSKIWWKSRDARRRERTKCDVFFISFFVYNDPEITVTSDWVALLQQEIALVFMADLDAVYSFFQGRKAISSDRNSFGNIR